MKQHIPASLAALCMLLLTACTAQRIQPSAKGAKTVADIMAPHSQVERLVENMQFLEGPVWDASNQRLIFSEVMTNKLHEWSAADGLAVFMEPSGYAGGNFLSREGDLLSCQGGMRRIAKLGPDKNLEILTDKWEGQKFNSPNDIVQKSDGTIWFTDPDYGLLAAYGEEAEEHREMEGHYVFRLDPAKKKVTAVCKTLSKPNGLVFSRDEKKLFVGNSDVGDRKLVLFNVRSDNTLSEPQTLRRIESKTWGIDGLKMDEWGNLYAACGDGVNIFRQNGEMIGKIDTDFEVTNLCFGGAKGNVLFLTGHTGLFCIQLKVRGKEFVRIGDK